MTSPRSDGPVFVIGIADGAGDRLTDRLGAHPNVCRIPRSRLLVDLATAVERSQPALAAYGLPEQYWRKAVADFFNGIQLEYAARYHKTRWTAYASSSTMSIEQLDRLFPTAQFVHVATKPRGGAGRLLSVNRRAGSRLLEGRYLEVAEDELISGLESCAQRVLQFLGEPGGPGASPDEEEISVVEAEIVVDLADARLRRGERP